MIDPWHHRDQEPQPVVSLPAELIIVNGTTGQRWDQILEIRGQNRGNYRQWVAQAGTLVADLLTVAGADHVITMDLHVLPTFKQR